MLLHGDAAFTGQGSVYETLILAALPSFTTGGTIHVIVNNQIGFTTSPEDFRFSRYPSDVGKAFDAPIFHVNGDDPEAVVQAARLAVGFRQAFGRDVFIDFVCYRRYGHNELDEPTFTQPTLYQKIKEHPSVAALYGRGLVETGLVDDAKVEAHRKTVQDRARPCSDLRARADAAAEGPRLRRRVVGARLGRGRLDRGHEGEGGHVQDHG